jgi:hypothetical protein
MNLENAVEINPKNFWPAPTKQFSQWLSFLESKMINHHSFFYENINIQLRFPV